MNDGVSDVPPVPTQVMAFQQSCHTTFDAAECTQVLEVIDSLSNHWDELCSQLGESASNKLHTITKGTCSSCEGTDFDDTYGYYIDEYDLVIIMDLGLSSWEQLYLTVAHEEGHRLDGAALEDDVEGMAEVCLYGPS